VLIRYRETAHMHTTDRTKGLMADVHGGMVCRLSLDLMAQGVTARVVWFDPDHYAQWLSTQGAADTPAIRGAWAALAVQIQSAPRPTAPSHPIPNTESREP
jgi:hypothetical protein